MKNIYKSCIYDCISKKTGAATDVTVANNI
jgi:hypothetical protein